MSDKRHVVKVRIMGDEYTLRTDEEPQHVVAVAAYLDQSIHRIASGSVLEPNRAAILAAMQITDELLKLRQQVAESDEVLQSLANEIRRWLPPAKRGDSVTGEHPAQPAVAD